jgi:hypothetical protein
VLRSEKAIRVPNSTENAVHPAEGQIAPRAGKNAAASGTALILAILVFVKKSKT